MGALQELPTVVEAALAAGRFEVDLLPEVLADVADPEIACLAIERELPWVADTERPDLRPGIRVISGKVVFSQPEEIQDVIAGDERIVRGNRIVLADRLPASAARGDGVGDVLVRHGLGCHGRFLGGGRSAALAAGREAKRWVHVDAQNLPEVGREILAGVERIALESAIAVANIEAAVRPKLDI